jgi:hypothetical protein
MSNGAAVPMWLKVLVVVTALVTAYLAVHSWRTWNWDQQDVRGWAWHVHRCHLPITTSSSTPMGHSTPEECTEITHIPPPPPPPK